jgi:hypothetical protein
MTPFLYCNMRIASSHLNANFAGLLKAAHCGLPHVRTVQVLFSANKVPHREKLDALNRLISVIPRNSLRRFE